MSACFLIYRGPCVNEFSHLHMLFVCAAARTCPASLEIANKPQKNMTDGLILKNPMEKFMGLVRRGRGVGMAVCYDLLDPSQQQTLVHLCAAGSREPSPAAGWQLLLAGNCCWLPSHPICSLSSFPTHGHAMTDRPCPHPTKGFLA